MIIEIKIPTPGESISEVEIGRWMVEEGNIVEKGEEIAEIESEKATLILIAEESGEIHILASEGETVAVESVACTIDTEKAVNKDKPTVTKPESPQKKVTPAPSNVAGTSDTVQKPDKTTKTEAYKIKVTPAARSVMKKEGLSVDDVIAGLKRITRKDVEMVVEHYLQTEKPVASREVERTRMSAFRRKLSNRLVSAKNEMAMLTTFNEVDMTKLIELRSNYQQQFTEKYGFKLGFMSFFTKAVSVALEIHPAINSMIDDDEIISPQYHDISIAVQTPKGLMVPVIRNAETKSISQLENEIKKLAGKARNKLLSVEEMSGGTFTITNGGVFGSLLSTPIINPPQSSILGMHTIKERPVAVDGNVAIRQMMYLALSYDHRLIDGKDSVEFLIKIKELIENPEQMLLGGKSYEEVLLGL